jgi:hypothetical protein
MPDAFIDNPVAFTRDFVEQKFLFKTRAPPWVSSSLLPHELYIPEKPFIDNAVAFTWKVTVTVSPPTLPPFATLRHEMNMPPLSMSSPPSRIT